MKDPCSLFLNLPDAAQYISRTTGKPLSEAAVLQMAMELRLKLSVILDTPTWAHEGEIVTYDLDKLNAEIASGIYTEKLLWREWNGGIERASPCLGGNKFLNVYDRFTSLQGIYDLPFFGDAWITVENKLWELSGNQKTDRQARYGVFLEDDKGNIYRFKDFKRDQKEKLPSNALLVVKQISLDNFLQKQSTKKLIIKKPSCGTKAIHELIDRAFYQVAKTKNISDIKPSDVMAAIKNERQDSEKQPQIDVEQIIDAIKPDAAKSGGFEIHWVTPGRKVDYPFSYRAFRNCVNKLKKANIAD